MSAPGRVTFQTRVPVLHIGGGLSLKAVFNFGSKRESECDRICNKVEKIHRIVADQAKYVHPYAMVAFLDFVDRFFEARMVYYGQRRNEQGASSFFNTRPNNLKVKAEKLIELGETAYREGVAVSTAGSSTKSSCQLYHHDPPKNTEGRCLLCFPDLPPLEPKEGTGAFLTWEAYLNSFQREDILAVMNQDPPVTEESPATLRFPNPVDASEMASTTDSNHPGLEVSDSEILSMWQTFSSAFTPKRTRGDSTR